MNLQSKKILITGAGGFIGSHLTEYCLELGLYVRAFIHYNSRNHWGWLENLNHQKNLEIISGDIMNYDSVFSAMQNCDTVIHLAALIGIPYSYVSPIAYVKTNIEGTYNVLEAARKLKYNNILITSTSETYGTAQYVPINEDHPLVGQSPYSASKIAADQLAISYYKSFDLPVKIVRPFNTYGPRQSARAIIPSVIIQLLDNRNKLALGNLSPTRDLTYVMDTVSGFLAIAESDDLFGHITNIGMNKEIKMEDLVLSIAKLMNVEISIKEKKERIRPGNSEVYRLKCDNSKILSKTSWKPVYTLDKGLLKTIDWFKNKKEMYKTELYNI